MTTQAYPSGAMHEALASYLDTQIKTVAGLANSECVKRWPTPTAPLRLARDRVVIALVRHGEPARKTRIGGPVTQRVDVVSGTPTARFDWDQVEQGFTLGLWACTQGIRDDVDQKIHGFLNRPYSATVASVMAANMRPVSFQEIDATGKPMAASDTATGPGLRRIEIADSRGIWPGAILKFTSVAASFASENEATAVLRVGISQAGNPCIDVLLRKPKTSPTVLSELQGRTQNAAEGLSLRMPLHFNAVARFDFDEPMVLDDMGDGQTAQAQEWRSARQGIGATRHLTEGAIALQKSLNLSVSRSAPVPSTKVVVVF